MFLIGLLSLAAVGGAAYAMGDVFTANDDVEDEIEDDQLEAEPSDGEFLDVGENFDDPEYPILSENNEILGEDGDETLRGGPDTDLINGYEGDDQIDGGDGDDMLRGGEGDDTLFGNAGNDLLSGEDGDDTLDGGTGDDTLQGQGGLDVLVGGDGADELVGGEGDDTLSGDDGNDALHGGYGDDHLSGGEGEDTLFGGDGDDLVSGVDGTEDDAVDFLNGGAGDDTILADSSDVVTAGAGADDIVLTGIDDDTDISVMGFEPGQDKLLVTWDALEDEEDPDITIEDDPENENLTRILINGQEVAQVFGAQGITPEDIHLISQAQLSHIVSVT